MKAIESRIEKLEKNQPSDLDDPIIWIVSTVAAENGKPVEQSTIGWRYDCNGSRVEIMRLENETEEELQERAANLARQNKPKGHFAVLLMQITE
jgi:hypothetical protein